MVNVLVYPANDAQSLVLVALISECDADGQFRYLPVDSAEPERTARMCAFLRSQGLDPAQALL